MFKSFIFICNARNILLIRWEQYMLHMMSLFQRGANRQGKFKENCINGLQLCVHIWVLGWSWVTFGLQTKPVEDYFTTPYSKVFNFPSMATEESRAPAATNVSLFFSLCGKSLSVRVIFVQVCTSQFSCLTSDLCAAGQKVTPCPQKSVSRTHWSPYFFHFFLC